MEGEPSVNATQTFTNHDETEPLIRSPSISIKAHLWKLLGLPSNLSEDYIDSENYSWCMSY